MNRGSLGEAVLATTTDYKCWNTAAGKPCTRTNCKFCEADANAGRTQPSKGSNQKGGKAKGGKGNQGKGGTGNQDMVQFCADMLSKGTCPRGDDCRNARHHAASLEMRGSHTAK